MTLHGRRLLVLGGARSGKSAYAESLLADEAAVDYLATAGHDPSDAEWVARVAQHRARRPAHWRTVEAADLAGALDSDGPPMLVDSVTAWLTGAMDTVGAWQNIPTAQGSLASETDRVMVAWAATTRSVVAVSDEVGGGIVPESASGRLFRDQLGLLNQRLAAVADEVWLVTAGIPLRLR